VDNNDKQSIAEKAIKYKNGYIKWAVLFVCLVAVLGIIVFFTIQKHIVESTKSYIISDITEAPVCDAIMVLGARVYRNGTPSPVLRDRLDYGYELYKQGKANKILVSGDHGQIEYNEAIAMKEYLLNKNIPGEDIFMDHAGFNTYDSMYRAKAIFCIDSLLISTQDFHIYRSVYIARKLGLDAYGYPCEDKPAYKMGALYRRESLARVKAFWDTLVKRKPKYLGDTIPISGDGNITDG
jgi:vancomycin permeability regulator SanA